MGLYLHIFYVMWFHGKGATLSLHYKVIHDMLSSDSNHYTKSGPTTGPLAEMWKCVDVSGSWTIL